jgi:glutamine---fructose-6-phosphate transaminase (isomerizing)
VDGPHRHETAAVSLRDEILEQPAAARRFLDTQTASVAAIAEAIRAQGIDHVVIAARGTSDHAAIYAQYVLGVRHGLTAGLATPSVVSVYGADPGVGHALVLAISQSGASPDIVAVVEAARRQGAPTVALTNDPSSPLAERADWTLDLSAGPELAIAATKTYTASLLAVAALSAAMVEDPVERAADQAAVAAVPDALEAMLSLEPEMERIAAAHASADRLLVIARGYEYATAREWAIKIKELAHVFADPYSAADFEHGPVALIEPGVPVIAVVRDGPTAAGLIEQLERLRDDLDAQLTIVSDMPGALGLAAWPVTVVLPPAEWLAPIATIVAGQFHALYLTIARGLDPDAPRNIHKVTRTR